MEHLLFTSAVLTRQPPGGSTVASGDKCNRVRTRERDTAHGTCSGGEHTPQSACVHACVRYGRMVHSLLTMTTATMTMMTLIVSRCLVGFLCCCHSSVSSSVALVTLFATVTQCRKTCRCVNVQTHATFCYFQGSQACRQRNGRFRNCPTSDDMSIFSRSVLVRLMLLFSPRRRCVFVETRRSFHKNLTSHSCALVCSCNKPACLYVLSCLYNLGLF